MTTTQVRTGRHECALPDVHAYTRGAIVRCDDCGRCWRYSEYGGFFGFGTQWLKVSRLRMAWITRRKGQK